MNSNINEECVADLIQKYSTKQLKIDYINDKLREIYVNYVELLCKRFNNNIKIIEYQKEIQKHKTLKRIMSFERCLEIKMDIESIIRFSFKIDIEEDLKKMMVILYDEYFYKCKNNHIYGCVINEKDNKKCRECCIF